MKEMWLAQQGRVQSREVVIKHMYVDMIVDYYLGWEVMDDAEDDD